MGKNKRQNSRMNSKSSRPRVLNLIWMICEKSVFDPMINSIDGALVCGVSDFSNLLEQEMIKSEGDSLKWKAQKMPFFALIFESSLTGDDFDEMISMIEEIGSYKMELVKEKMGN